MRVEKHLDWEHHPCIYIQLGSSDWQDSITIEDEDVEISLEDYDCGHVTRFVNAKELYDLLGEFLNRPKKGV
jgi:hypothetical protein